VAASLDDNLMDKKQAIEAVENVRLMIATPCYGGQVTADYLQSLVSFTRLASEIQLKFFLYTTTNESLVTRARNRCVAAMLESDATHLMFIDADIRFDPMSIFQMLFYNEDVVCASYPKKGINWQALLGRKFKNVSEMQDAATMHVVNSIGEPDATTGLIPVKDAGTGFMLIRREVIEHMIACNPDWSYAADESYSGKRWHAVFDCEIDDDVYLSEDYTFCRRWQRLGGTVWLDPAVTLAHTGTYTFGFS